MKKFLSQAVLLPFIVLVVAFTGRTQTDLSWVIEPADQAFACDENLNPANFNKWSNMPKASSSCGSVFVGNDFDLLKVNTPSSLIGPYYHTYAVFGPQYFNVTGELAFDPTNNLGCNPFAANTFAGKIAVIDRGSCYFVLKVKHAQDAGAIGVLIVNNVPGTLSGMAAPEGDETIITIPSMMVTPDDGNNIKSAMAGGPVVITMQRKVLDWECTPGNLPRQFQVEFTAVDGCRNMISKTAAFILKVNTPPEWTITPSYTSAQCSDNNDLAFTQWLTGFSASGTCGPVKVTNNFCGFSVDYPFTAAQKYASTWAAFGPDFFEVSGIPELAFDNSDPHCCGEIDGFTPGRIAVIDRGYCTFVTKARYAQNAGAIAVIFCNIDNGNWPVMADDGFGGDIHIPVIMISKADADILKGKIAAQQLQVTLFKKYHDPKWCNSVDVLFTATDGCGNFTTVEAGYSVIRDNPVWTQEPEDFEEVCDNSQVSQFDTWLNSPAASGCGEVKVTHDLYSFTVNSPDPVSGPYVCEWAEFGPQVYNVTGNMKMDELNMLGGSDFAPGFFTGKIAVIDRGIFSFTTKVKNAQNAGAIGVILCNSVFDPPPPMGGEDASITIPALMIGKKDGELLKQYLHAGYTLSATLSRKAFIFDCADLPKQTEITFTATDLCRNQISKKATFTLIEGLILDDCPDDPMLPGCSTQEEIAIAASEWADALRAMESRGSCNPGEVDFNPGWFVVPQACNPEMQQISIEASVEDECGNTVSHTCTFTVLPYVDDLTIDECPGDPVLSGCSTQEEIDDAVWKWINGMLAMKGHSACKVEPVTYENVVIFPTAFNPALQQVEIVVTTANHCGAEESVTCTFTVLPYDGPIEAWCTPETEVPDCLTPEELDLLFQQWKDGFGYNGGCSTEEDNMDELAALDWRDFTDIKTGGTISFTYMVWNEGDSDEATCEFVIPPCITCETAYAKQEAVEGEKDPAFCFLDNGFTNWGWTNHIEPGMSVEMPLYAGAGQCDPEKGWGQVGTVMVNYIGSSGLMDGRITVTYKTDDGYSLDEVHVYAGCGMFPLAKNNKETVAPGMYTHHADMLEKAADYQVDLAGIEGPVWLIAHAVVCDISGSGSTEGGILVMNMDCPDDTEIPGKPGKGKGQKSAESHLYPGDGVLMVYPNPFAERVYFDLQWNRDSHALIEIYDIRGAKLTTLYDNRVEAGLLYRLEYAPVGAAPGMLLYRLVIDNQVINGKVLYQKQK
jgi:hypothetical protein